MNCEENRLRTFVTWPTDAAVEPQRIAKAGFFCTGNHLEVQCFKCGGKISEWNFGDQVMAKHRRLNPNCAFVCNPMESDNVPILASTSTSSPSSSQAMQYRSEDARLRTFARWPVPEIVSPERLAKSGFYYLQHGDRVKCAFCSGVVGHWERGDDPGVEHRRHFPLCPLHASQPPSTQPAMAELGIQTHHGPKSPRFASLEARLQTFRNWPAECRQTPQQLAQAGFYYVGVCDQVRCYHCDLGLRYWDPEDEPWREHARWLATCPYLLLVKGEEFVRQVTNSDKLHQASTESEVAALLCGPVAQAALDVGLDAERVKLALQDRLQTTGRPFSTAEELIDHAFSLGDLSSSVSMPTAPPQSKTPPASSDSLAHPTAPEWSLEEENRRLKEARLCKICMDDEVGVVFLPCGHLVTCMTCAPSLADCPMCRQPIKATVRTFLS